MNDDPTTTTFLSFALPRAVDRLAISAHIVLLAQCVQVRTGVDLSGIDDSSHDENVVELASVDGESVGDSSGSDDEMIVSLRLLSSGRINEMNGIGGEIDLLRFLFKSRTSSAIED